MILHQAQNSETLRFPINIQIQFCPEIKYVLYIIRNEEGTEVLYSVSQTQCS